MTQHVNATPQDIDVRTFWSVVGQRATGVTIVTADSTDGPVGFLGLSASHVSATPPIMLVSIDRKTSAYSSVRERRHFAINYLPADATAVADAFSGRLGLSGSARFDQNDWHVRTTGAPIYNAALGAFDCVVEQVHKIGQVSIFVGRVVDSLKRDNGKPLVYFQNKYYGTLGE